MDQGLNDVLMTIEKLKVIPSTWVRNNVSKLFLSVVIKAKLKTSCDRVYLVLLLHIEVNALTPFSTPEHKAKDAIRKQ
jgi:hypothetical protein